LGFAEVSKLAKQASKQEGNEGAQEGFLEGEGFVLRLRGLGCNGVEAREFEGEAIVGAFHRGNGAGCRSVW
jgi:hypothetical protein